MNNLLISGVSQNAFPEVTSVTDTIQSVVVPATPAEQTIAVPAGALYAKFSSDGEFWCTFDGSAVVVPGSTAESIATTSVYYPTIKYIRTSDTININAEGLTKLTVEFFR